MPIVDLTRADLSHVDLVGANLRGAYLPDADLTDASLNRADLSDADLTCADLSRANLTSACLFSASLRAAHLSIADLSFTDLRSARIRYAYLRGSQLTGADLRSADLTGSDLSHANLRSTIFCKAVLKNTQLGYGDVSTGFGGALGLEEVGHVGPSAMSPEALKLAEGSLPDVFLKGIGFQDWEILNTRLHDPNLRADEVIDIAYRVADLRTNSPIQTNSIFFSYSSKDQGFVESIEKRFDDEGIRSWRDVHDLTGGPIEPQLDRAISLNGTVFLVLSKHSVNSDWVEWEVNRARKRQKDRQAENGGRSDVLFPVALDDAWKKCHWDDRMMDQIKKYKVVDCSGWRDDDFQETYVERIRKPLGIYYRDEAGTD